MLRVALVAVMLMVVAGYADVAAQTPSQIEKAWKPLLQHEGVAFTFLFYPEANTQHNGVVIRLHNQNPYAVRYQFTIVFRSEDTEHTENVAGFLDAGQRKTGELDGLFWVPFKDGSSISHVGLRGYRIEPEAGERQDL